MSRNLCVEIALHNSESWFVWGRFEGKVRNVIHYFFFFNNDCLPYNSFLTIYNISQTLSLRSWELKPQARNKTSLLWIPFMLIDMESLSAHWEKKGRNDSKPVQDQQLQTKDSNPKYTAAREKKKPCVRPGWQKSNSRFNNPVAFLL